MEGSAVMKRIAQRPGSNDSGQRTADSERRRPAACLNGSCLSAGVRSDEDEGRAAEWFCVSNLACEVRHACLLGP
jgi:hypothetical protein